jgi:U3 small nucleolar RNA-associated protein 6
LPNDFEFRKKCIEIYRQFLETDDLMEEAYESIRRDMMHVPEARAYLATRHLFKKKEKSNDEKDNTMISISDPDFIPALRLCIADFELACQEASTSVMWVHYIDFLLGWFSTVNEENLKLYLSKSLAKTFKTCQKKNALSSELYELWAKFLIESDQKEMAVSTVKQGLKSYPHSTVLWIYRIKIAQDDEVSGLYRAALELNADSFALWSSYNDWMLTQWQEEVNDKQDMEALYFKACERGAMLLPSLQIETEDRNRIKDLIQKSFVKWAAQADGALYARQVYRKILLNFYPTFEFLMACLEIENQYGDAKEGQDHVESLYDRIVRVTNDKQGKFLGEIRHSFFFFLKTHKITSISLRFLFILFSLSLFTKEISKSQSSVLCSM